MPAARMTADQLQETIDLVSKHGTVTKAAAATGQPRTTLQARYNQARLGVLSAPQVAVEAPREQVVRNTSTNFGQIPDDVPPRRHIFVPDTQIRPGVPLDHIPWIGDYIAEKKPDVIVVAGDWWDHPSLNSHSEPGSAPLENQRYQADLEAGNAAFAKLCIPIDKAMERDPAWKPRRIFTCGNHEERADRVASADPKWMGHVGSNNCQVRDFEWHSFLKVVEIDGVHYSHYFQNTHSKYPIGGNCDSRLNKIGCSFVQGHEQGKRRGDRITATGETWYGLVAGSCYLHQEEYRGAQGQRHWRGICVLNEVNNGEYDLMEVSLNYLCRKNTGMSLYRYMRTTYGEGDWEHLR